MMESKLMSLLSCMLQDYTFVVGGVEIEKENILTMEISYSNLTPIIIGEVVINDIYDLKSKTSFDEAGATIIYKDALEEYFSKEFVVVDVDESQSSMGRNMICFRLQDKFSYTLSKCHISKGFKDTYLTDALSDICKTLGIDNIPESKLDFSQSEEKKTFIVSKGKSALDYFTRELKREGCSFYHNKNSVCVRKLDELIPAALPLNGKFVEGSENEFYMNRIVSAAAEFNDAGRAGSTYISKYFDPSKKGMVSDSNPYIDKLQMNNTLVNLQSGTSVRDQMQPNSTFKEREFDQKQRLLDQCIMRIYVPGYVKNDVNQRYELIVKANDTDKKAQTMGNPLLNGMYVSKRVSEKMVNNRLIQRITLHRTDAEKT